MRLVTLRALRERAALTQDQLAAASGIPQATISALENGRIKEPGYLTIPALATALNATPDEVVQALNETVAA